MKERSKEADAIKNRVVTEELKRNKARNENGRRVK